VWRVVWTGDLDWAHHDGKGVHVNAKQELNYVPHTILAPQAPWPGPTPAPILKEDRQSTINALLSQKPRTMNELIRLTGLTPKMVRGCLESAHSAQGQDSATYYWLTSTPYDKTCRSIRYQVMWWLRKHPWSDPMMMGDVCGGLGPLRPALRLMLKAGQVENRQHPTRAHAKQWRWVG